MKRSQKRRTGHPEASAKSWPAFGQQAWIFGLFLAVAMIIAYLPLWHAGYIWDDDAYVTQNPLLTARNGLWRIWFSLDSPSQYFPLTYTTFYLERALWGLNPLGYHLVNLALHILNAFLVWRVLAALRAPGARLAAAIFALHPVQVESVAWITERKNVLMGCFFLLALLAWIQFIRAQNKGAWRYYLLTLGFYGLALAAKTTACALPVALLLVLWLEKLPINLPRLRQIAPFVVMGLGMGLVTIWWERHHQGTQGKVFEIGLIERGLIACRAIWFYAGKLFWPANLAFSYPRWNVSAANAGAYGWVAATAILGVAIWRVRRWVGRSLEVGVLFFVATLGPVLGFIMLYTFRYSFVADHYQYLASLGLIALAAAGMKAIAVKLRFQTVFYAPLLLVLGVLTWTQSGMYANAETLWRKTIRLNPNSVLARYNLGIMLDGNGSVDEAISCYQQALAIDPDCAEARNNLGHALLKQGRADEAIAQYQLALKSKPDYADAYYNLGVVRGQQGKPDEAIADYQAALQINPDHAESHYNLGVLLGDKGRLDEAISNYQAALEFRPDYADAHNNLANAFLKKGQPAQAIVQYQAALEIDPANLEVQNNLAWILATCVNASLRNGPKAAELARQANTAFGGANPIVLHTLAAALAEAGQFGDAIQADQKARDLFAAAGRMGMVKQIDGEAQRYRAGLSYR